MSHSICLTGQTLGGYTTVADPSEYNTFEGFLMRRRLKFDELLTLLQKKVLSTYAYAQNDLYAILPIQKGTMVKWVSVAIIQADGNAATFAIGDTGTANGWIASSTLNQTAGTIVGPDLASTNFLCTSYATTPAVVAITSVGKFYTADDAIVLKLLGTGATLPSSTTSAWIEVAAMAFPVHSTLLSSHQN